MQIPCGLLTREQDVWIECMSYSEEPVEDVTATAFELYLRFVLSPLQTITLRSGSAGRKVWNSFWWRQTLLTLCTEKKQRRSRVYCCRQLVGPEVQTVFETLSGTGI